MVKSICTYWCLTVVQLAANANFTFLLLYIGHSGIGSIHHISALPRSPPSNPLLVAVVVAAVASSVGLSQSAIAFDWSTVAGSIVAADWRATRATLGAC